jgi:glyoxalase family protein
MSHVLGLHHVTAIASEPQRTVDFYAGLLGLRLVKRTVNFDDPETYHLYFGDATGGPGSIMTFFPWPGARRGRQGSGQVAVTAFAIAPEAIEFWKERLRRHGLGVEEVTVREVGAATERVLAFRDADGLLLELVAHPDAARRPAWEDAPGIPAAYAIRGFHAVTLWVREPAATERVLVDTLGFRLVHDDGDARRYAVGDGGPSALVDVRVATRVGTGVGGAGTVHHVAFAVADDAAELAVRERARAAGMQPTPVIDRQYFHSVYFREPGGILFELATLPPGFAVDEPADHLGERLMLPPQYEAHRGRIEESLPPIHLPAHDTPPGAPAV